MRYLNVGCGQHRAPSPWLNLDVHHDELHRPDLITDPLEPFPFEDGTADRIYLGHVLEHVKLDDIPWFLNEAKRTLADGGELLAVGPDVFRVIEGWKAGREPWELVQSALEHADYPGTTDWPQAQHQWNCHEARVVEMLERSGFDAVPLESPPEGWPVVQWSAWQFCIQARKATA